MQKLHLILPMAGRGSRFFENGFVCPKPLIEIAGKPFFYWAARSIEKYVDCADLTFVVLEEHIRDFAIDAKIKAYWPDARMIALPAVPLAKKKTYKVRKGDTLFSIASSANMSVNQLKKLNGIRNNNLKVGQTLKLSQ